MFVIMITYKKPFEFIEPHLAEHRLFLNDCYKKNIYIVAGRKTPPDGGVIVSQMTDRLLLEEIIQKDPLIIHDLVSYNLIEFNPVICHPDFRKFMPPTN